MELDRTEMGAIAGIAAILTRDCYNMLSKLIGFAKFYVWSIAADLFIEKKQDVLSPVGTIVGLLADLCMGALIGVAFAYFMGWIKDKRPVLKGLGFGLGAWLLLFGVLFHSIPSTLKLAPKDPLSNLSGFVGHSIFGLALGIYFAILQRKVDLP